MHVKEVLDRSIQFFQKKQIPTARLDAELLVASCLGYRRIDLYLKFDQPLKELEIQKCRDLVTRRGQGEPVAYLLKGKDFYKSRFFVDERVLIPRPETELLVEEALRLTESLSAEALRIVDLGCGSGCIGLSILKERPQWTGTLLDISDGALAVARMNAESLQLGSNVEFVHASAQDWLPLQTGRADLILANPPYIDRDDERTEPEVVKYEPAQALFSDEKGIKDLRDWIQGSANACRPGGIVLFEHGQGQGQQVMQMMLESGFESIHQHHDLAGIDRFVSAKKGLSNG